MADSDPVDPVLSKTEAAVSKLEQTIADGNGKVDQSRIVDLIEQIKESADKLAVDHTSRAAT